jgi:hypothetical protein
MLDNSNSIVVEHTTRNLTVKGSNLAGTRSKLVCFFIVREFFSSLIFAKKYSTARVGSGTVFGKITAVKNYSSWSCDLYYKDIMIISDDYSIVNKFEASPTDAARVVIYDRHMFIV